MYIIQMYFKAVGILLIVPWEIWNVIQVILKLILAIGGWGISWEIAISWMYLSVTDDNAILLQVTVWCRQSTNITWANVGRDLCRHMASSGYNELYGLSQCFC